MKNILPLFLLIPLSANAQFAQNHAELRVYVEVIPECEVTRVEQWKKAKQPFETQSQRIELRLTCTGSIPYSFEDKIFVVSPHTGIGKVVVRQEEPKKGEVRKADVTINF